MKIFKILSFLILLCLLVSVVQNLYVYLTGTYNTDSNWRQFVSQLDKDHKRHIAIDVTPNDNAIIHYNEVNTITQDSVVMIPERVTIINKDTYEFSAFSVIFILLNFAQIAMTIVLFVYFIKIVLRFSSSDVFEKKINKYLSIVGYSFIAGSFISSLNHFIRMYSINQAINLKYFSIIYGDMFDFSNLISGLIVLMINFILKTAITMKQEQDLTI